MRKYKGFKITPWSDGFQVVPGSLNTTASFIVKKEGIVCGFAFAVGFLTFMANPKIRNKELLDEAMEIIKRYIDNQKMKHLEEWTFEYRSSNFISVQNPDWWIKSAKK